MLLTKISPCYEGERGSGLFNGSPVVPMVDKQAVLDHTPGRSPLLPPLLHTNRDDGVGNASLLCQINPLPREPPVDITGPEMDPVCSCVLGLLLEQRTYFLSLTLEPVSVVAHCDRPSAPQD